MNIQTSTLDWYSPDCRYIRKSRVKQSKITHFVNVDVYLCLQWQKPVTAKSVVRWAFFDWGRVWQVHLGLRRWIYYYSVLHYPPFEVEPNQIDGRTGSHVCWKRYGIIDGGTHSPGLARSQVCGSTPSMSWTRRGTPNMIYTKGLIWAEKFSGKRLC